MGQLLSALVLVSFVAGALAFNVIENQPKFTNDTIQIGVVVEDFEASVKFYTEVIGMQEVGGFSIDEEFGKASGLSNGVPFDVTILKLADSEKANQWKVVHFGNPPKAKHSNHIQDQIGMQYTTLYVENVDPYIARLEANNVELLNEPGLTIGDGRRFLLFQDPNGIFIEIIGR